MSTCVDLVFPLLTQRTTISYTHYYACDYQTQTDWMSKFDGKIR